MTDVRVTPLGGGVHQVTLPLPWALDHVHCYAIDDPGGWTIIDCGLGTSGTRRRWVAALEQLGSPPIRRIVVTHYHPDHVGAVGDLAALTGAEEIVQGREDADRAWSAWGDEADYEALEEYLVRHGMPPEEAARSSLEEGEIPVSLAQPTRLVEEGCELTIGGEPFQVLVLPGHADGHIALFGTRSGRLFGGDVLLLEITPNVGRWEDTKPDPLGRYLHTLRRLETLEPVLVYPGHRRVIDEAAARAAEIRRHHEDRLESHVDALRAGARTPYEVGRVLWGDALDFHQQRFALAESIAHLERLAVEGRAEEVEPGVWRHSRSARARG